MCKQWETMFDYTQSIQMTNGEENGQSTVSGNDSHTRMTL